MILHGQPIREGRLEGRVVLARIAKPSPPAPLPTPTVAGLHLVLVGSVADLRPTLEAAPNGPMALVLTDSAAPPLRIGPTVGPVVGGLSLDLFRDGDRAVVDGFAGTVDLPGVEATHVVTAFLQRADGRILLLKRSEKVGSSRGLWAGVSGFIEQEPPETRARIEIEEETGIPRDVPRLRRSGGEVRARQGDRCWVVHPFLYEVPPVTIRLDWEHTTFEWVGPGAFEDRPTVPKLKEAFGKVGTPTSAGSRKWRTKR